MASRDRRGVSLTIDGIAEMVGILWTIGLGTFLSGCGGSGGSDGSESSGGTGENRLRIGVSFETLQTEFWVAALDAFRAECEKRKMEMLEAIANGDANRQLRQIRNFIAQKVDGLVVVPKDSKTILPMIKDANAAGIPIVLFNRPPDASEARSATVVAENYGIAKATVEAMIASASATGPREKGGTGSGGQEGAQGAPKKRRAMILVGDLGDINAIGRRDGFEDAAKAHPDLVEVVARVPTEWNLEKAQAGTVNALQADPGIDFIFASSDQLLPAVVSALKSAGRYRKVGEEGHVILGGFDGDETAYQLLVDGYLDATGVQDVAFEVQASLDAVLAWRAGDGVPATIKDPGFVIHRGNLEEMAPRMWGANLKK